MKSVNIIFFVAKFHGSVIGSPKLFGAFLSKNIDDVVVTAPLQVVAKNRRIDGITTKDTQQ